jgi:hypothetical protein
LLISIYNTNDGVESSWISKDTFWNKLSSNRAWHVYIGVAVFLEADTGEFKKMVFPLDGVITRNEHPDWF